MTTNDEMSEMYGLARSGDGPAARALLGAFAERLGSNAVGLVVEGIAGVSEAAFARTVDPEGDAFRQVVLLIRNLDPSFP